MNSEQRRVRKYPILTSTQDDGYTGAASCGVGMSELAATAEECQQWQGRQTGSRCRQQSHIRYRKSDLREYRHHRQLEDRLLAELTDGPDCTDYWLGN